MEEDNEKLQKVKINKRRRLNGDHPEMIKIINLTHWMTKGGADVSKVEIRYYSNNFRGVHIKQNAKKGEEILFVPY